MFFTEKPKKGDKLFIVHNRNRRGESPNYTEEATIESVGSKYVTVISEHCSSGCKFHKDTGTQVTEYARTYFLYHNEQEYLDKLESEKLLDEICDFFYPKYRVKLSLEKLKAIKKILDE